MKAKSWDCSEEKASGRLREWHVVRGQGGVALIGLTGQA